MNEQYQGEPSYPVRYEELQRGDVIFFENRPRVVAAVVDDSPTGCASTWPMAGSGPVSRRTHRSSTGGPTRRGSPRRSSGPHTTPQATPKRKSRAGRSAAYVASALVLTLVGTATLASAQPLNVDVPTEQGEDFRVCVLKNLRWYEQDWQEWLAKYPGNEKAQRMYAERYPATYEEAATHPRIHEVCPQGGEQR